MGRIAGIASYNVQAGERQQHIGIIVEDAGLLRYITDLFSVSTCMQTGPGMVLTPKVQLAKNLFPVMCSTSICSVWSRSPKSVSSVVSVM